MTSQKVLLHGCLILR